MQQENELTEVLQRARDELTELHEFTEVALAGLEYAAHGTRLIEALQTAAKALKDSALLANEEELRERVDKAKRLGKFALSQASSGFPYLFSVAIIRCWSILEVAVDDLLLALLSRADCIPQDGVLLEIKGPLLPFLNAPNEERARRMASAIKQKLATALKPGAARFEELLGLFGLFGAIDDSIKRILLELSEVRNIFVHKNGVADKRFVDACPWMNCKQGVKLSSSPIQFTIYLLAAMWYLHQITLRVRQKFQLEEDKELAAYQSVLVDICKTLASREQLRAQRVSDLT